jgi:hypothetical protein
MENPCVRAEELEAAWTEDIHRLAEAVAEAMNSAQAGRIIADSEEPVRDANAAFRQRLFEKALGLLQNKQEAFSPSAQRTEEQGQADDDAPDG